jgi:hypothetical protein
LISIMTNTPDRTTSQEQLDEKQRRSAAATFKDRDAWMRAVAADSGLSQPRRLIAVRLALHFIEKTGRCEPAIETLAHEVGMDRASVFRAIDALAERGWLEVEGSKGRHRNNYRLVTATVAPARPFNRRTSATVESANRRRSATPTVADVRLEPSHQCDPISVEDNRKKISEGGIYPPKNLFGDVEVENPKPPPRSKPESAAKRPAPTRLGEFLAVYPRKDDPDDAGRVYRQLIRKGEVTEQELIDHAGRYAAERAGEDPRFTKKAANWLRAGSWKNEPVSPVMRSTAYRHSGGAASVVRGVMAILQPEPDEGWLQ